MKWFFVFLKILLLLIVLLVAFQYWSGNERFTQDFACKLIAVFSNPTYYGIWLLLFFLTFCNWLLEAVKWQALVNTFYPLTLKTSLRSILVGVSFSFIGFSHMGHYAGRAWYLPAKARIPAIGSLIIANYPQALVSYGLGCVVLNFWLYMYEGLPIIYSWLGLIATLVAFVIGVFLYFEFDYFHQIVFSFIYKLPEKWQSHRLFSSLHRLTGYLCYGSNRTKSFVFIISWIRYLLFVGQFTITLMLFDISLPIYEILMGAMLVYLVKSAVPTISFLSDLGIREVSAYYFLGSMGAPETSVLGATLTVWAYNLLLPACIGAIWNMMSKDKNKS